MTKPVAVIAGASPGLGSAICAAFHDDMTVIALGHAPAIHQVAAEVPRTVPLACDLTHAADVDRAMTEIESRFAPPELVVYNAHQIKLQPSADTTLDAFRDAWNVGCLGAFIVAQRTIPAMRERGAGVLIFTGATGSIRGGKRSAAFASAKFALRGLAQSLARELGPSGIHVAHVVIDGVIWSERSRARFGIAQDAAIDAHAVAATYRHLATQDRSAWTHELDLRPHQERWS